MILHALIFAFAFVNYAVKDSLQKTRDMLGPTFAIARQVPLSRGLEGAVLTDSRSDPIDQ